MVKANTPGRVSAIAALTIAAMLAGCQQAPRRSASYFEAHPDEAKTVAAQCQAGTNKSDECADAELVASREKHRGELQRELGTTKREPDKAMHF